MVSGTDIANLLLHKQLDSSEPEVCRTFDSFEKGTTNLTSLLIAGKTKVNQSLSWILHVMTMYRLRLILGS